MEAQNISVGLDIGTTKIVAMIGRKNEYDKLEILGIGKSKSLGVHRGVVNNITQTIQSIQQAVSESESDSGLKIGEVTVGIAGQHIRSLQHSDYITREVGRAAPAWTRKSMPEGPLPLQLRASMGA